MTRTQTIEWAPLSPKHKQYIKRALTVQMSVAEGAIRSGKTIDHCIIAAAYLEKCRDKIHLASGSTIANAKLNIGFCNGFGLECLFRGRCHWGKYRDNDALFIQTQAGEKIVIFAGGGKSDSYKRILGNSYGMWIATEINEHYDSDDSRTSFISVAFGRQVAARDPLVLWDLNPCNPRHSIYSKYIDKWRENPPLSGYQYVHFTIDDNLSIDAQRRAEIESRYIPGSVWYRRDIKGERCVAEGLIYQTLADNIESYLIDDPLQWAKDHNTSFTTIMHGVDFGGHGSATKFQTVGITPEGFVVALDEERIDHKIEKQIDPAKLNSRFASYIQRVTTVYGPGETRCDSAESVLINGLRSTVQAETLQTDIANAQKRKIINRIRLVQLLIAQRRIFLSRNCPYLIEALCSAVYDPKSADDERLDDGTTDIDSLDALEYCIEPWTSDLEAMGHA